MKEKLRFLGMDVHAETIAAAIAEPDGEVRSLGTIPNRMESVRKLLKKLGPALYEPGAVLVAGGKPVTGHDGIRDALNVFLSSGARMKLDTRAVIESSDGLAVLHGAWSPLPLHHEVSFIRHQHALVRWRIAAHWLPVHDQ
jgi:hypothetical protein